MSSAIQGYKTHESKNSKVFFQKLLHSSFDGVLDGDASRESVVQAFVHVGIVRITPAVRIEPGGRECVTGGEVWCVAVVIRAGVVEVIVGDEVVTSTGGIVVGSTLLTTHQIYKGIKKIRYYIRWRKNSFWDIQYTRMHDSRWYQIYYPVIHGELKSRCTTGLSIFSISTGQFFHNYFELSRQDCFFNFHSTVATREITDTSNDVHNNRR